MTPFTITEEKAGHSGSPPPGRMMKKRSWICSCRRQNGFAIKDRTSGAAFCKGRYPQYAGGDRQRVCFLFRQNEELAGVVMLLPEASGWDRRLWGDEGHEESVYLHRLAINRRFAGAGLGRTIMTWAETGVSCPGKRKSGSTACPETRRFSRFTAEWVTNQKDSRRVIICLKKGEQIKSSS